MLVYSHTAPIPFGQVLTWILKVASVHGSHARLMPGSHPLILRSGFGRGKTNPLAMVVGYGHGHSGPMLGRQPTTQDNAACVSHMAPMLSGQTPIRDVEGGFCPTAPMSGGQPLLLLHGLGHGDAVSVLGSLPHRYMYGGISHSALVPGAEGTGLCFALAAPSALPW